MKKIKLLYCSLGIATFLLLSFSSIAQQRKIKGIVQEAKEKTPLQGATVSVKNSKISTITDLDGQFEIMVPNRQVVLDISFVGYETRSITVGVNETNINISLQQSAASQLTDVVVIGYGTQKKVDVTGAISSVKGAALKQSPAANLSNSIAGRIPGVILSNRSGEPGQDASEILIRGKGTLNDNSPLIVIDGVANRGDFDRLNPNDIESITVLKDASAAIYGAQAANGVILVTTKRGTTGEPVISYSGSYSLTQPTRLPKLINSWQFATYKNEINARLGIPPQFTNRADSGIQRGERSIKFS